MTMNGLSASELPPQTLHAGDVIEYFSHAFVCGDSRGFRRAVVTRVDGGGSGDYPISVDTSEAMLTDMMVKLVQEQSSKPVTGPWRKVRTFQLVPGTFADPTRASPLKTVLEEAVTAACEAVREALVKSCGDSVPETPQSSVCSSPDRVSGLEDVPTPSAHGTVHSPAADGGGASPTYSFGDESEGMLVKASGCSSPALESGSEDMPAPSAHGSTYPAAPDSGEAIATSRPNAAREESFVRSSLNEIVDLVSSEDDRELQLATTADHTRSVSERKAACYMRTIPNSHARDKIRHQASKKRAQWHVPRSRKRQHLAKRAITRSGSVIYHAKTFRSVKFEALLKSPEVVKEVEELHARRSSYQEPSSKKGRPRCHTVQWPAGVEQITTCKRNGVKFPDIGSFDPCSCFGDCFLDTCSNVASASFCAPKYCKLGARCSNAPRTLDTLKLYDTGRMGLGVYTTTDLDVGDVIGEYCGELIEFAAAVEGQPAQALKHNSGYTMLYNAKYVQGNYVYVDAQRCGSITRFLSHSCKPNAAFVEQQTRSRVRVFVKMIKNVNAGAHVTVHYGNERWFKCACDGCWAKRTESGVDSEEE